MRYCPIWRRAASLIGSSAKRERAQTVFLRCIIFESGLTNVGDVFLRRQAECRQVLGVALSEAGRLLCLSTNQNSVR